MSNKKPTPSLLSSIFDESNTESRHHEHLFDTKGSLELNQKLAKRCRTTAQAASKRQSNDGTINEPKTRADTIQYRMKCVQHPLTESLLVCRDTAEPMEAFCEAIASTVKTYGVAVGKNVIDLQTIETLQGLAAKEYTKVTHALKNRNLTWNEEQNNHETIRFREVVVRCKGRMDVLCDTNQELAFWENHPIVEGVVNTLLYGGETDDLSPRLVYAGWIFSAPGSADQPFHQDGIPLFPTGSEHLPAYAINVFIPLDDTSVELGPTEFKLQSHAMPATRSVDVMADSSCPLPALGDMLVYDYRICHRGTANLSGSLRSVLYLMYARPWFKEHVNFGSERLLDKETTKEASK